MVASFVPTVGTVGQVVIALVEVVQVELAQVEVVPAELDQVELVQAATVLVVPDLAVLVLVEPVQVFDLASDLLESVLFVPAVGLVEGLVELIAVAVVAVNFAALVPGLVDQEAHFVAALAAATAGSADQVAWMIDLSPDLVARVEVAAVLVEVVAVLVEVVAVPVEVAAAPVEVAAGPVGAAVALVEVVAVLVEAVAARQKTAGWFVQVA